MAYLVHRCREVDCIGYVACKKLEMSLWLSNGEISVHGNVVRKCGPFLCSVYFGSILDDREQNCAVKIHFIH